MSAKTDAAPDARGKAWWAASPRSSFALVASIALAPILNSTSFAEKPVSKNAGDSPRVSATGFIEYYPGNLPVILSAPHGGTLTPSELPDRNYGKVVRDANTIELAQAMRAAMQKRHGSAPALIICKVARHKLDCNREVVEAAQGDALAEKAWREYHAFIDEAETALLKHHSRGLYLDIHGHAHEKQRIEIGYALSKEQIQLPDAQLNALATKSTIRSLATSSASKATFTELLRGKSSLGALLETNGIDAVPSPTMKFDAADLYFNGGYDIRQHGSVNGGKIDAIQLEHPQSMRNSAARRQTVADALAESLDKYFQMHYAIKLH